MLIHCRVRRAAVPLITYCHKGTSIRELNAHIHLARQLVGFRAGLTLSMFSILAATRGCGHTVCSVQTELFYVQGIES